MHGKMIVWSSKKMAEPTALHSDIVAGIDQSSVTTQGESTFFSSVMSDGTVVRFEGKNISINEEGITINPGSEVVSLDAVGKIYMYSAEIRDAVDNHDSFMDVGYGYTYSADKTSVEQASEVHKYPLYGWGIGDWLTAGRFLYYGQLWWCCRCTYQPCECCYGKAHGGGSVCR